MPRGGKREGAGRPAGTTKPEALCHIATRVEPDVIIWLDTEAERQGITRSEFIRLIIRERMKNDDTQLL